MNAAQSAAFVFSQSVAALAEIAGMHAENQHRVSCGNSVAYGDEAFFATIEKYGLHRGVVMRIFEEAGS